LAHEAVEIHYRSTSGKDGTPTDVSGVVLVPAGDAPPGGWPIASIGHPTTGINDTCAPSANPEILETIPGVVSLLAKGFTVVVSDYQGLGTPGPHPYLDPKTAAYNVIDAVRAARQVSPDTSDTWVAYGFSQGGQATWAANEMAIDYGSELHLLGSVSLSPPADLRPLVDSMEQGTLSVDQIILLPIILSGVQASHPELNIDDYLHGALGMSSDLFLTCNGEYESLKTLVAKNVSPDDYKPTTPEAADRLRQWLGDYSLPTRRASSPMLVAYGDSDPILPAAWTTDAVSRACDLGDVIDVRVTEGQGHVPDISEEGTDWIMRRFDGITPTDSCPKM
jgi:pimeloyl-ACP methyl ester carboxylesterase